MLKIRTLQGIPAVPAIIARAVCICLVFLLPLPAAMADVLDIPGAEPGGTVPADIDLPRRGSTMAEVRARYGEPMSVSGPVAGDHPKRPPITRWNYEGFSVFFEHDHVVHSVIPGNPQPIYHKDELNSGY